MSSDLVCWPPHTARTSGVVSCTSPQSTWFIFTIKGNLSAVCLFLRHDFSRRQCKAQPGICFIQSAYFGISGLVRVGYVETNETSICISSWKVDFLPLWFSQSANVEQRDETGIWETAHSRSDRGQNFAKSKFFFWEMQLFHKFFFPVCEHSAPDDLTLCLSGLVMLVINTHTKGVLFPF